MKYLFSFLLFITASNAHAQVGCTDPQALNYDAGAMTNDGSCSYGLTEYTMTLIAELPEQLKECSGVEYFNSSLWVHNDGGNEDKVFRIDSMSGEVLQSVIIATGDNIDWEDITESEDYVYVGDFGNNPGNRTDLRVYRINKSDFASNIVNAELIEFEYSDQVDFSVNDNNNNFDCEAFIYHDDSLHLFTKNWVDNQTKHYTIPAIPGDHSAQLVETFDVGGLITGADISENDELVLIGYTEIGINFMWLLFDFNDNQFFSGNKRKISLGTGITNSQTEGITFRGNGYGYVCSEEFKVNNQIVLPQKLLSFSIEEWVDNTTSVSKLDDTYQIAAYPNPFDNVLHIEFSKPIDRWQLYNATGRLLKSGRIDRDILMTDIETENLSTGVYFFEIVKDNKVKTIQLSKL